MQKNRIFMYKKYFGLQFCFFFFEKYKWYRKFLSNAWGAFQGRSYTSVPMYSLSATQGGTSRMQWIDLLKQCSMQIFVYQIAISRDIFLINELDLREVAILDISNLRLAVYWWCKLYSMHTARPQPGLSSPRWNVWMCNIWHHQKITWHRERVNE